MDFKISEKKKAAFWEIRAKKLRFGFQNRRKKENRFFGRFELKIENSSSFLAEKRKGKKGKSELKN